MLTIQVIPDRFNATESEAINTLKDIERSKPNIRRPTCGIQIKKDTYATLSVMVAGGTGTIKLVDAGSNRIDKKTNKKIATIDNKRGTDVYSNFLLQQVNEERAEKSQVLETFGEPFIFLFGERPRVLSFQGVLLNTFDFNWEAEWWENYNQYLRGTKCVENDAKVFLSFDETLVSGYILGCSSIKSAQEKNYVTLSFQLFVTSYATISALGNPVVYPSDTRWINNQSHSSVDNPFRPVIRQPNEEVKLGEEDFFEAIDRGLRTAIRTYNRVKQLVNFASRAKDAFPSVIRNFGEVIRVPIGFAGSLSYDEEIVVKKRDPISGAVKMLPSPEIPRIDMSKVFEENKDEYVGESTHYGSSVSSTGVVRVELEDTIQQRLSQGMQLEAKARNMWLEEGFIVPPARAAQVSSLLDTVEVGLHSAGATNSWRMMKASEEIVSGELTGFGSLAPSIRLEAGAVSDGLDSLVSIPGV